MSNPITEAVELLATVVQALIDDGHIDDEEAVEILEGIATLLQIPAPRPMVERIWDAIKSALDRSPRDLRRAAKDLEDRADELEAAGHEARADRKRDRALELRERARERRRERIATTVA